VTGPAAAEYAVEDAVRTSSASGLLVSRTRLRRVKRVSRRKRERRIERERKRERERERERHTHRHTHTHTHTQKLTHTHTDTDTKAHPTPRKRTGSEGFSPTMMGTLMKFEASISVASLSTLLTKSYTLVSRSAYSKPHSLASCARHRMIEWVSEREREDKERERKRARWREGERVRERVCV
jgi:hypothetical protein